MYERKYQKIAPRSVFMRRVVTNILVAGILAAVVLFIGIGGYHWIAGFCWLDSLLEAAFLAFNSSVANLASTGP